MRRKIRKNGQKIASKLTSKFTRKAAAVLVAAATVATTTATTVGMMFTAVPAGFGYVVEAKESGVTEVTLEEMLREEEKTLPSKVDLRDRGVVTPVKSQGQVGTCYAFGMIAAAETSILSELGLTYEEFYAKYGYNMDLSERAFAYFSHTLLTEENDTTTCFGNQNGEGSISTPIGFNSFLDGGFLYQGIGLFASGMGPHLEEDIPYRGVNGTLVYYYEAEDGEVAKNAGKIVTGNKNTSVVYNGEKYVVFDSSVHEGMKQYYPKPYCYDAKTDSWEVDESQRFQALLELEEGIELPSPADIDEDGNYKYNELGTLAIKSEINKGRAVAIGYHADSGLESQLGDENKYINTTTWAHYTYTNIGANHAVCIVGYDDNYSKENFNSEHQPPGDGAFIVKNSWGSIDGEFPNYRPVGWGVDGSGYFYISYYDQSMVMPETYDFDVSVLDSDAKQYYVGEYDYATLVVYDVEYSMEEGSAANVFEADDDMLLRDVSYYLADEASHAKVEVYILNENYQSPKDGKLAASFEKDYYYAGFHRETLEEQVYLLKGQKYSVVLTSSINEGEDKGCYYISIPYSVSEIYNEEFSIGYYAKTVVNRGESYIIGGGEVSDLVDIIGEIGEVLYPGHPEYCSIDNFAIKTYSSQIDREDEAVYTFTQVDNTYISKYGNVYLNVKKEDFLSKGYEYGDIVSVNINGTKYEVPFVKNYSDVDAGQMMLVARDNDKYINLAIYGGNFATTAGIAEKTVNEDKTYTWNYKEGYAGKIAVSVSMSEKAGYKAQYVLRNISFTKDRADYPNLTDAEYANFRMIRTTGIREGVIYRSSSPISLANGRNTYADAALKASGVNYIINLADTENEAKAYEGYDKTYYSTANVLAVGMGADFTSEEFKTKLAQVMNFIANNKGTYLVHCSLGQDRAGMVSAILEGYMGASYDEIVADYMLSYKNYYGITEGDERYAIIAKNFNDLLSSVLGVEDASKVDLKNQITTYLSGIGVSDGNLALVRDNLSGKTEVVVESPRTGDSADMLAWCLLGILSLTARAATKKKVY